MRGKVINVGREQYVVLPEGVWLETSQVLVRQIDSGLAIKPMRRPAEGRSFDPFPSRLVAKLKPGRRT